MIRDITIVYFYADEDYEVDLETKAKLRYLGLKDAHIEIDKGIYRCTDLECRRIKKPRDKLYIPYKRDPTNAFLLEDKLVVNNFRFVSVYDEGFNEDYRILGVNAVGAYKNLLIIKKRYITYIWDHYRREIVDVYYGEPYQVYNGRLLVGVKTYDVKGFLRGEHTRGPEYVLNYTDTKYVIIDLDTQEVEEIPKEHHRRPYVLAYLYGVKDEVELDKIVDISPRFAIVEDSEYYIYDIENGERYPIDVPLEFPTYVSGDIGVFLSGGMIYVRDDGLRPLHERSYGTRINVSENKIVALHGNFIIIIDPAKDEPILLFKLNVEKDSKDVGSLIYGDREYVFTPLPVKSDSGKAFGIEVMEFNREPRTLRDRFMILVYNDRAIIIRATVEAMFLGAEIKDGRIEAIICPETVHEMVSVEIDPEDPIIREEDLKRARFVYPLCFVDIRDLKDPIEVDVRINGPFAYVDIPPNNILILASPFYRKPTKYAISVERHGEVLKELVEAFKERPVETLAKHGSIELLEELAKAGLLKKISDDEYVSTIPPERLEGLMPVSSKDPIKDSLIKAYHVRIIMREYE